MKFQVVSFVIVLGVALAQETYTTENDNFDIDSLVKNKKQLENFAGCFLDTSPCERIALDFKQDIGEAIQQLCAKCTAAQKRILITFIAGLKNTSPQVYEAVKQKYDPEGIKFPALDDSKAGNSAGKS